MSRRISALFVGGALAFAACASPEPEPQLAAIEIAAPGEQDTLPNVTQNVLTTTTIDEELVAALGEAQEVLADYEELFTAVEETEPEDSSPLWMLEQIIMHKNAAVSDAQEARGIAVDDPNDANDIGLVEPERTGIVARAEQVLEAASDLATQTDSDGEEGELPLEYDALLDVEALLAAGNQAVADKDITLVAENLAAIEKLIADMGIERSDAEVLAVAAEALLTDARASYDKQLADFFAAVAAAKEAESKRQAEEDARRRQTNNSSSGGSAGGTSSGSSGSSTSGTTTPPPTNQGREPPANGGCTQVVVAVDPVLGNIWGCP